MTAGNRGTWFDKQLADVVFVDLREHAHPDVVADSRCLPLPNGMFDLVVFDPPHVNFGARSNMNRDYGHHTTENIRDLLRGAGKEAARVAKRDGLLAFKWNDHDQKLANVLPLLADWQPMFGQVTAVKTKHACTTTWLLLKRKWEPAMPTTAEMIERYIDLRNTTKEMTDTFEKSLAPYKEAMTTIESAVAGELLVLGADSVKTEHGTAYRTEWTSVKVADRETFMDFVFDGRREGFLTNAVGKEAVKEYMDEHAGTLPPGLDVTRGYKVNFRSPT